MPAPQFCLPPVNEEPGKIYAKYCRTPLEFTVWIIENQDPNQLRTDVREFLASAGTVIPPSGDQVQPIRVLFEQVPAPLIHQAFKEALDLAPSSPNVDAWRASYRPVAPPTRACLPAVNHDHQPGDYHPALCYPTTSYTIWIVERLAPEQVRSDVRDFLANGTGLTPPASADLPQPLRVLLERVPAPEIHAAFKEAVTTQAASPNVDAWRAIYQPK